MAFDFPNSPTAGQLFTPSGGPTYRWDGVAWSTQGAAEKQPIYSDGSVAMTGQLTLVAPPVNPTDAAAKSYVDGAVRYDSAQSTTAAQRQQARQNIYAAPFDAMAFSGMQINGSMDVSQETGTAQITMPNAVLKYAIDMWAVGCNNASAVFKTQQAAIGLAGFSNGLFLTATTPISAVAAGDYANLYHFIEGYRWARLAFGSSNAQPVTISFWVYATVPGTMSLSLRGGSNRSYVVNVTINNPLTWEYKTVTIPGDTTAGTWAATNGIGVTVGFSFACGSTYQTAAGAWQAGNFFGTAATTNFFAAANNNAVITGLTILPGNEAPSQARSPFIMRPFDQELLIAQRYWEKSYDYAAAPGSAVVAGMESLLIGSGFTSGAPQVGLNIRFKVAKRTAPTMQCYATQTGAAGKMTDGANNGDIAATIDSVATTGARAYATGAGPTGGVYRYMQWTADARL